MITRSYRKLFKRKERKKGGKPEGERWDYKREDKEEREAKKGNRKQTKKKFDFGSMLRSTHYITLVDFTHKRREEISQIKMFNPNS